MSSAAYRKLSIFLYCVLNIPVSFTVLVILSERMFRPAIELASLSFSLLGWLTFKEMERRKTITLPHGLAFAGVLGFGGSIVWSFVAGFTARILSMLPFMGSGNLMDANTTAAGIFLFGVFLNPFIFAGAYGAYWASQKEERANAAQRAREKLEADARERKLRWAAETAEREEMLKTAREARAKKAAEEKERAAQLTATQPTLPLVKPSDMPTVPAEKAPVSAEKVAPPSAPIAPRVALKVPSKPPKGPNVFERFWAGRPERWPLWMALLNAWIAFWLLCMGVMRIVGFVRTPMLSVAGYAIGILPYPGILFQLIPKTMIEYNAHAMVTLGFASVIIAALVFVLAWGFFRESKWAWPAELVVCTSGLVTDLSSLVDARNFIAGNYGRSIPQIDEQMKFAVAGALVALALGVYAFIRTFAWWFEKRRAAAVPTVENLPPRRVPPIVAALAIADLAAAVLMLRGVVQKLYPPAVDWLAWDQWGYLLSQTFDFFPTPAALGKLYAIWQFRQVLEPLRIQASRTMDLQRDVTGAVVYALLAGICVALAWGLWRRENWARLGSGIVGAATVLVNAAFYFKFPQPGTELFNPEVVKMIGWTTMFMESMLVPSKSPMLAFASWSFGAGVCIYLFRPRVADLFDSQDSPLKPVQLKFTDKRARVIRMANLVVRVCLIVEAVNSLLLGNVFMKSVEYAPVFVLAAAVPVFAVVRGWKKADRLGFGIAVGYFSMLFTSAWAWGSLWGFVVLMSMGSSVIAAMGLNLLVAFFGSAVGMIAAIVGIAASGVTPASHAGSWSMGLAAPLLIAVMALSVGNMFAKGASFRSNRYASTKKAIEFNKLERAQKQLLVSYARCLFDFQSRHADAGFPASVQELGPSGANCLNDSQLTPNQDGFTVEYQPKGEPPYQAFRVVTTKTDGRKIEVDENGEFWNGSSKAYVSVLYRLVTMRKCVDQTRIDAAGLYPDDLSTALVRKDPQSGRTCFYVGEPPYDKVTVTDNKLDDRGYRFTYSISDPAKEHFALEARPLPTSAELRSYFTDESGTVHATPLDRSATVSDPEVDVCAELRVDCR